MALRRLVNRSRVTFDALETRVIFAEDWNEMADIVDAISTVPVSLPNGHILIGNASGDLSDSGDIFSIEFEIPNTLIFRTYNEGFMAAQVDSSFPYRQYSFGDVEINEWGTQIFIDASGDSLDLKDGVGRAGHFDFQTWSVSLGDLDSAGNDTIFTVNDATQKYYFSKLTASKLLATDASHNLSALDTATYPSLSELAFVKGVTSAIQTQLAAKLAILSNLSDLNNFLTARQNLGSYPIIDAFTALGSEILGEPIGTDMSKPITTIAMTNQVVRICAIYLSKGATLHGAKWIQTVQGDYTANNYNGVGLYSYSGGTLTLVASSTNDGAIWKGAAGIQKKAFSANYVATAGVYYLAMLYCRSSQVTPPSVGRVSAFNDQPNTDFTNGAVLGATYAAQTALPTPTVGITTFSPIIQPSYMAVY